VALPCFRETVTLLLIDYRASVPSQGMDMHQHNPGGHGSAENERGRQ